MTTLDEICTEANARLQQRLDERIAQFKRQATIDAQFTRRSFAQKFRWLRTEIMREFKVKGE